MIPPYTRARARNVYLEAQRRLAPERKLYPVDETPAPLSGFHYVKTRVDGGQGVLDPQNRPVVDFNKVVSGEERGGAFVTDDRSFANIIMGPREDTLGDRHRPPRDSEPLRCVGSRPRRN